MGELYIEILRPRDPSFISRCRQYVMESKPRAAYVYMPISTDSIETVSPKYCTGYKTAASNKREFSMENFAFI
jgi:hypothetical protein